MHCPSVVLLALYVNNLFNVSKHSHPFKRVYISVEGERTNLAKKITFSNRQKIDYFLQAPGHFYGSRSYNLLMNAKEQ